jgi:hypothetical protein
MRNKTFIKKILITFIAGLLLYGARVLAKNVIDVSELKAHHADDHELLIHIDKKVDKIILGICHDT